MQGFLDPRGLSEIKLPNYEYTIVSESRGCKSNRYNRYIYRGNNMVLYMNRFIYTVVKSEIKSGALKREGYL